MKNKIVYRFFFTGIGRRHFEIYKNGRTSFVFKLDLNTSYIKLLQKSDCIRCKKGYFLKVCKNFWLQIVLNPLKSGKCVDDYREVVKLACAKIPGAAFSQKKILSSFNVEGF